jgi:hypothetical protein
VARIVRIAGLGRGRRSQNNRLVAPVVLAALFVALLPTSMVAGSPRLGPGVIYERNIGPAIGDNAFPANDAFDPIVATHPTDPKRIAVSYHRYVSSGGLITGLRITHDGGETWTEAARRPYVPGRAANWHSTIAWGPGPAGASRLYWADTTATCCDYLDARLTVAYTDDDGETWSSPYVEMATPPTPGGLPDITVDTNPKSPNYGVVYATYNWFPEWGIEPGLRVVASADFGVHWSNVEVPAVPAPPGYPYADRIGYRIRTGPDGGVYVTWFQADLTDYPGRYGRMEFGMARLGFSRGSGTFAVGASRLATTLSINGVTTRNTFAPGTRDNARLTPRWTSGLDVNQTTGRVYLAISDYHSYAPSGTPRGVVKVGKTDDRGKTWRFVTVPAMPPLDGRPQSAHRPTLALSGSTVFVGFHTIVDVPYGTDPDAGLARVGNAYTVSRTGGASFSTPVRISGSWWDPEAVAHDRNGVGIRDRAAVTADGTIFYTYGDGRFAAPQPSEDYGESKIVGALIAVRGK